MKKEHTFLILKYEEVFSRNDKIVTETEEKDIMGRVMGNEYFLKQMVNLIHASICSYRKEERLKREFASGRDDRTFSEEEHELILKTFRWEKKEYPVIVVMEELIMVQVWNQNRDEECLFIGPIIPGRVEEERYNYIRKKYKWIERLGFRIQTCPLDTFVSGVLVLFWGVTGKELSTEEFWERNKEQFENVQQIFPRMTKDIFYRQEHHGPHNPYEQELRELESIKNGDMDALKKSVAETYEGEIGILAKDPLRHHKNIAIGNITLASRAAIRGGLQVEQSFSMADSLIQQVEELDNVPEVEMFKREAKYMYARSVSMEHRSEEGESKNPLIAGVKDYIFSHLHSSIQISDIAESLHVNPDYLSHLFSTQEKVTIKRYILREKIKRSQNLLRYSGYSLQDIAFYLGFSSQSHFSKTFREITGMSPNEYRKQFLHQGKWEIM